MEEVKTSATAEPAAEKAAAKPAVKNYVCNTKCYWNDRLWKPGDTVKWGGSIPEHFSEVK